MYEFSFSGGRGHTSPQETEQFYLYFIVNGKEVSFYSLRKTGIITKNDDKTYLSPYPHCKVFMHHSGFGRQRRTYSFYLELLPPPAAKVKIDGLVSAGTFFFNARAHFLKKEEVLQLIDSTENSYQFIQNQGPIPLAVVQTYISVDRSELRQGVRRIRI